MSKPWCPHGEAVHWNPHNNVVQCHKCGEQFVSFTWTLELLTAAKNIVRDWDALPERAAEVYPDQRLTATELSVLRAREPESIRSLRTAIAKAEGREGK